MRWLGEAAGHQMREAAKNPVARIISQEEVRGGGVPRVVLCCLGNPQVVAAWLSEERGAWLWETHWCPEQQKLSFQEAVGLEVRMERGRR